MLLFKFVNNKVYLFFINFELLTKKHITFEEQKNIDMKIFTKEMLINAGVTLAVVMVALYVHDKYVTPMLAPRSASASTDGEA